MHQFNKIHGVTHVLQEVEPAGCVDVHTFRTGMRMLSAGVTVLTTRVDDQRHGLTATAVCSLSPEPARLLACVNKAGRAFAAMTSSSLLAVNVLSHDQVDIAKRFAGMDGDGADRFGVGDWEDGAVGELPTLRGSCCSLQCRIAEIIDSVSHGIMICNILKVSVAEHAKPLVYSQGRFTSLNE